MTNKKDKILSTSINKKHSNKLMRMRVLFQGIAVLVFAAIIYLSR